MAKKDDKDDAIRRRRRREEEDQEDLTRKNIKPDKTQTGINRFGVERSTTTLTSTGIGQSAQLQSMIQHALGEIERLHHLYLKFLSGVDKIPPLQARTQFDALISSIDKSAKMTSAMQFQVQTLKSRVRLYTEKWDKLMKAREGVK